MAAPPIISAARGADVETLRRLLAEGVSPDALVDQQVRRRPLHCLCLRDDEKNEGDRAACFELLRDAGANLEAGDQIGYTILHLAARDAFVELISLLVQARVNLDATLQTGDTALHLAARYGAVDSVEVLLAAGASLNLREGHGLTAFSLALLSRTNRWMWPLFLRAGAEIPTDNTEPYIVRVKNAGGFQRYAQAHLARITSILETPLLPPELVRKVLQFWLHAGYY
mmetsp:Transcript_23824/g.62427  ORF Transcript_23824/g.62427 Transcript_23824/m.62427 type:complete len:227 (-) Transcript_23824:27-707(-)